MSDERAVLDRSDPLPLWAQLLADLRRRLAAGAFTDRFPTDKDLTLQYGVSRQTVREAVRKLDAEGVLDRRQGWGTRVRPAEFEMPWGNTASLFRAVESAGVDQESEVLALQEVRDQEAAVQLGLGHDEPLVHLRRRRMAGGQPLALDRVWLPARLARQALDADFTHTGLYDVLASHCGLTVVSTRERIEPVVPNRTEAALLGLGRGRAAFALERWSRTGDGLVEWRHSLIRGDRYHFVAEWSAARGVGSQHPKT
ncbi:MAG: GntR family transcriptional regulator [Acidimicrobiales bacterium]